MNIDWIIPCRYVEVHDNLGTIVGAGIDTFWQPELPSPIQFMLAVRLLGLADEFDPEVKHSFKNQIRDPDGAVLGDTKGEMAFQGGQSARADWLAGITLPLLIVFQAAGEGTHTVEFSVGDVSKSFPVHVVHGLPPGQPPGA